MSQPIDPRQALESDEMVADEEAWDHLEARLAPLDALVPPAIPPWRAAALSVVALVGVAAASLVSLLVVVTLEHLLIPNGDAADLSHGIALGVSELVWGLLSLGILAAVARLTIGRAATLGRGNLTAAVLVLLMQAGWTVALHAWVVGVAGYVVIDLVRPGTLLWPAVVILVAMALTAVRLTAGWVALALLGCAALGIGALVVETLRNGLGAIADGEVSGAGLLSAAQLAALGSWWWVKARTTRERTR